MDLTCPYCSETMTVDEEVVDGQNVLCPYCGKKSSFRQYVAREEPFSLDKPSCVVCPQVVMFLIWAVFNLYVYSALMDCFHPVVTLALFVVFGASFFVMISRWVTFARVMTTVIFAGLAAWVFKVGCSMFCDVSELDACEGSRPDDNGGVIAILFILFAVLAVMPWLPPANRYYRELRKQKEDLEDKQKGVPK